MAEEQSKHQRCFGGRRKGLTIASFGALLLLAACRPAPLELQAFDLARGNPNRDEFEALAAEQKAKIANINDGMRKAAKAQLQQKESEDIAAVMGWNLLPNEKGAVDARAAYFRAHPDRVVVDTPDAEGDPAAGKDVYGRVCVACHDPNGTGNGGTTGANLAQDATRLAKSDDVLTNSIKNGVNTGEMPMPMPPQGALVSDKEIRDVIAYLREAYGKK